MDTIPAGITTGEIWDHVERAYNATVHWLISEHVFEYLPHLLVALLLGFLIGLERRAKHKTAGVRTYMVIAAASALITLLGTIIVPPGTPGADPTRLAAQILNAIGMVGAGVIVVRRGFAGSGVTTAAMTMFAVGVGMSCGFGLFGIAITATIVVLLAVIIASQRFASNEHAPPVTVVCRPEFTDEVKHLFGQRSVFGGFKRDQDGWVTLIVQPQLSQADCEALLHRLMKHEHVREAFGSMKEHD